MPFLRSSTRPQAVECFFCLSPSILAPEVPAYDRKGKGREIIGTRWNWQCNKCSCWNVRDERGEMRSDHPAMHDSTLNQRSFSLRARPSSSHLPSGPSLSPFCQNCQANQVLIMNMLANYLPDENDITYASLYTDLPRYISSLHSRYPPVCLACQPAVEAALRKSDQKAQAEAWGSALRRGAGVDATQVQGRKGATSRGAGVLEVLVWRLRGALFCFGLAVSWLSGTTSLLPHQSTAHLRSVYRIYGLSLPLAITLFHVASILWIAWDPYWLRRVRSQDRAKVQGRATWIVDMMLIYSIRVCASAFRLCLPSVSQQYWVQLAFLTADILLFLHALTTLRISQPVSIQLVRPVAEAPSPHRLSHDSSSTLARHAPHAPHDALSYLSLSNNPIRSTPPPVNPIFGQASLHTPVQQHRALESEPMDWEPSPHAALSNGGWTRRLPVEWEDVQEDRQIQGGRSDWDKFGVRKQRMFGRVGDGVEETGLESLLAGWGLGTAEPAYVGTVESTRSTAAADGWLPDRRLVKRVMTGLGAIRLSGSLLLLLLRGVGRTETIVKQVLDNGYTALLCLEITTACSDASLAVKGNRLDAKELWSAIRVTGPSVTLRILGIFEPAWMKGSYGDDWMRIGRWGLWGILDEVEAVYY